MSIPFPLPLLTTAWGFKAGDPLFNPPSRLADTAKTCGFKSVAVQLSQTERAAVAVLQAAGLFVVGWDPVTAATADQLAALAVDGWAPQVEGPFERDALYNALDATVGAFLPKAVFTTYGGLDTQADVTTLKAKGIEAALVEVYKDPAAGGHSRVDVMLAAGQSYGFQLANLAPVLGTYQGETIGDYTWDNVPSKWAPQLDNTRFGIYTAEQTSAAMWAQLAALTLVGPPPPAEPPEPLTAAEARRRIAVIVKQWEDGRGGPAPGSRLTEIGRIARPSNTDKLWLNAKGGMKVKAALDASGAP